MNTTENTINDVNHIEEENSIENVTGIETNVTMLYTDYKSALNENKRITKEYNDICTELVSVNGTLAEQNKTIADQVDKISKLNALLQEANLYVTSEIPNSFEILMQTYNVIGMEGDADNCHGKANCANGKLILYSAVNNTPQNKNVLELTFYHELSHIILNSIGENELFENERLVEMLGRAIYSFLKTRKYDTQSKDRE